jgi:hypothetical protein
MLRLWAGCLISLFGCAAAPIVATPPTKDRSVDRVNPAVLSPQPPDRPLISTATQAAERGSLFMLRRVMGGNDPDPDYIIDVDTDGTIRYEGRAEVCLRGKAVGHLSAEALAEVRSLIRGASAVDVSTEKCRHSVVDFPETIVEIEDGFPPKTLVNRGLCGPVEKLAGALETAVGIDQWIGTNEQRKRCR